MRCPQAGLSIVLLIALVLAALASPLLAIRAAASGEHVLAANTTIGPGDPSYAVYRDRDVAQSFVLATSSSLLNLTLRVQNVGSNVNSLAVGLRANDPVRNLPSTTVLASQSIVAPDGVLGNYRVAFSPAPALYAGQRYWIVVSNNANQPGNGYEWHYSAADTYADGTGAIYNATTSTWSVAFTDMWFVAYGLDLAATIVPAMTANPTEADPQDLVDFILYYNHTGAEVARTVWMNESLPSGLTYVDDSAASLTPFPSFTFTNVMNGVHLFRVTARVDVGVAPGTLLTNRVTLAYANATGVVTSGLSAQASVLVGMAAKQLYLGQGSPIPRPLTTTKPTAAVPSTVTVSQGGTADFALTPALALSFRATNLTATLWANTDSRNVESMTLNLTLMDANGTGVVSLTRTQSMGVPSGYQSLTFSFPSFDYTFLSGHRIQFRVNNDGSSRDRLVLAFNATSATSRIDLVTTTYVSIVGIVLSDAAGPASYWTPKDRLTVKATVSDPFGAAKIVGTWINVTDPSGGTWGVFQSVPSTTDASPLPAWKEYETTYPGALTNGTYRILVTALEDNGVRDLAAADAVVRAPSFTFAKIPSVERAKAGDRYAYLIWFNNTGTGPAGTVWINDTLPSQVSYQSYAASLPANFTGSYNWSFGNVGSGSYLLEIDVAVSGSANQVAYVRNVASIAFTDEKGHFWAADSAQADVIINGPVVSLTATSTPAAFVHANESVGYEISLTNAGDPARTLWLNETLPTGFQHVSDTAATFGGSRTVIGSEVRFVFTDMPSGATWTFTLTARAPGPLARGTTLTHELYLDYVSLNGVSMPQRTASLSLTAVSPTLGSGTINLPASATPGASILLTVALVNTGNEAAANAWVNLTLDPALGLVNASRPATANATSLVVGPYSIPVGPETIWMNLSIDATTPDRYLASVRGTIDSTDGAGSPMPTVLLPQESLMVVAASMALNVYPGTTTVEAGVALTFTVDAVNGGLAAASEVWLNLTLPMSLAYLSDTSNDSRTMVGSTISWHWANQPSGPHTFNLVLSADPNVADGSSTSLPFQLDYQDENRVSRPGVATNVLVYFVAPEIELTLTADPASVLPGARFNYTLSVRNSGSTIARWVSVSNAIDSRLEVLSYSAPVPVTAGPTLVWNLTSVNPGEATFINLTVRVLDGVPARASVVDVVQVEYSNSLGLSIGYRWSAPVTVTVDVDLLPLLWIGLTGLAAAPLLAIFVARRQRVSVEEVFLVYRDGVLISHLSRTLVQERDEDVLSGMLTAVQEFVRDAFQYGEHRELHQMEFGDYRILIERGRLAYLAVVYSGRNGNAIRRKVRMVLDRIETAYAKVLEKWEGDMDEVLGVQDMIREYLLRGGRGLKANGAE